LNFKTIGCTAFMPMKAPFLKVSKCVPFV